MDIGFLRNASKYCQKDFIDNLYGKSPITWELTKGMLLAPFSRGFLTLHGLLSITTNSRTLNTAEINGNHIRRSILKVYKLFNKLPTTINKKY